jgi:3-dehydroquinate synthase
MKTININLPKEAYDIIIGRDLINEINIYLNNQKYTNKFFLIDDKVWKLHKERLEKLIDSDKYITFESGEKNKNFKELEHILQKMLKCGLDRNSVLIAIGGGVTGDIGGLAASLFMRGISLVQVPTTLLSQVDSSVGGKTAINLGNVKNVIGSFYQPDRVFIDILFLETLEEKELLSGIGEIIKYGFILDYDFLKYIRDNFTKVLKLKESVVSDIIGKSIEFKADIVKQDEKEASLRKILNFGHTAGHGVELLQKFKGSHGQAVAIGMVVEGSIALNRGYIDREYFYEIFELCKKVIDLPVFSEEELSSIIENMKHDKKNTMGNISMVLPNGKGTVVIVDDITVDEINNGFRSIENDN